jgi:hypothetical protein
MAAHLTLVEPMLDGLVLLDDESPHAAVNGNQDAGQGIARPEPLVSYNARQKCFNGPCPGMVKFEFGCGYCQVCGVAQIVVDC